MSKLLCFLLVLLFTTAFAQGKKNPEEKSYSSNWLFYLYEESPNYRFSRVIPFYSYTRYPSRLKEKFWFWPLLAGYEVSKNPAPSVFPYAVEQQWYTLPFLSSGRMEISPDENMESSTLVSFLFMSYFQEKQILSKYFVRDWYSLPLLSYYHSETLWEEGGQFSTTSWGNPLFFFQDIRITHHQRMYPVYDWTITPASILLGNDGLQIMRHARWGRDQLFEMFALDSFALFTFSTTFSAYPGARYQRFVQYETRQDGTMPDIMKTPMAFPRNRLGIISPLIMFETSPVGYFSWQLLPLFRYKSEGATSRFFLLPLGLEMGSEGVRFSPQPLLFPLIYHDEMYGSWDILWPLFRYVDNPYMPDQRVTLRFVFDYRQQSDEEGKRRVNFSLLERLLFSYRRQAGNTSLEILPAGLLFGYYQGENDYQWRVLGCGYYETARKTYLQLLFLKIPLGDK